MILLAIGFVGGLLVGIAVGGLAMLDRKQTDRADITRALARKQRNI